MKKIFILVGIIILIALAIKIYLIYSNKGQVHYINSQLEEKYTALSNKNIWGSKLISSKDLLTWYVSEKQISIEAKNYNGDFYCGKNKAEFIKYESKNNSNIIGAWGSTSIVDCLDYYFIFYYGDTGIKLYGPFEINV